VVEEYRSGVYVCDVIEGTQITFLTLQELGVLQPYYSPNIKYFPEETITRASGQGVFRVAHRESGIVLTYNTGLITGEQIPKSYEDLLDPRWKNKGAISGQQGAKNWVGAMLEAHGEDFVKKVAQQRFDVHKVSSTALLDMVVAGEYIFTPTSYDTTTIINKRKGAPLEWVPLEPVFANAGEVALPKYSSHPHAALLLLDFYLSKKGGELQKAGGYYSNHKGLPGGATYKKYYGAKSIKAFRKWDEVFNRLFLDR